MLLKPLQNENVQIDKTKCATHEIPKFKLFYLCMREILQQKHCKM